MNVIRWHMRIFHRGYLWRAFYRKHGLVLFFSRANTRGVKVIFRFFFLANIKILKAELKLFLTIEICRQCRGKLDEELLQAPEAAEKTAASSWLYEEAKEQTQCTETENPLAVRSTC